MYIYIYLKKLVCLWFLNQINHKRVTYQFGVLWHKRLDHVLTVRCSCSTEGTES